MIVHTLCNSCLQPYRILIEAGDAHLIKQMQTEETGKLVPCPRLCGGNISLAYDGLIDEMSKDPRLKTPLNVTAKELYKAVNGAGLPDEIPLDVDVVEMLFSYWKVDAKVEQVDGAIYIHELQLESGHTVHLAAGQRGAQVLKITKRRA